MAKNPSWRWSVLSPLDWNFCFSVHSRYKMAQKNSILPFFHEFWTQKFFPKMTLLGVIRCIEIAPNRVIFRKKFGSKIHEKRNFFYLPYIFTPLAPEPYLMTFFFREWPIVKLALKWTKIAIVIKGNYPSSKDKLWQNLTIQNYKIPLGIKMKEIRFRCRSKRS